MMYDLGLALRFIACLLSCPVGSGPTIAVQCSRLFVGTGYDCSTELSFARQQQLCDSATDYQPKPLVQKGSNDRTTTMVSDPID